MNRKWAAMKGIIQTWDHQKNLFLSLINEEGTIVCANANMVRTLQLQNLRIEKKNFFDLLHPVNLTEFKRALRNCRDSKSPYSTELYLKNGFYHPMKWQFSYLEDDGEKTKTYLCVGHKLMDDEKLTEFNRLGEKNYQLIVEGLNAGILFQDYRGELIAANQKAAEIFNSTLERLYQLKDVEKLWNTTWEITTEEGRRISFNKTPFMRALQSGMHQSEVLIIRVNNGEDRWIHFSSQPLFEDVKQVPYAVVSNITDITKEKKLIQELKEKKALFSAFMNQTPNLAWVVDENANLVFASRAFYQYFGLDEGNCQNKSIVELVPTIVANALYEKHIQVFQTGIQAEMVEKVRWANGTEFVFHINIFPIDGITGKKLLGGHAVNLAEKYAVERQLQETNDRLLLLSRTTSDAIWEWDMQTGYIFRNDALMDMIGYNLEDPKGLSWWLRRIHPGDRNRVSDKVKEVTEKNLK